MIHPRILTRLQQNLGARRRRLEEQREAAILKIEVAVSRVLESDLPPATRGRILAAYCRVLETLRTIDTANLPEKALIADLMQELQEACADLSRLSHEGNARGESRVIGARHT